MDPQKTPGLLEQLALAAAQMRFTKNKETITAPLMMLELLLKSHEKTFITDLQVTTAPAKKGGADATTTLRFTQFLLSSEGRWGRNAYIVEIPTKHAGTFVSLAEAQNVK